MKPLVAAAVIAIAFAQPLFAQPDLREALDAAKVIAKQAQADAHRRVYDEGRILVVETDDGDSVLDPFVERVLLTEPP